MTRKSARRKSQSPRASLVASPNPKSKIPKSKPLLPLAILARLNGLALRNLPLELG